MHFSVIQILREINFGECRRPKTAIFAIFAILGAMNFIDLVNFSTSKRVQKFIQFKIQSLSIG